MNPHELQKAHFKKHSFLSGRMKKPLVRLAWLTGFPSVSLQQEEELLSDLSHWLWSQREEELLSGLSQWLWSQRASYTLLALIPYHCMMWVNSLISLNFNFFISSIRSIIPILQGFLKIKMMCVKHLTCCLLQSQWSISVSTTIMVFEHQRKFYTK